MSKINVAVYCLRSLYDAWDGVLKLPLMRSCICETAHFQIGGNSEDARVGFDLVITDHNFRYGSEDPRVEGLRISLYLPWDMIGVQSVVYQWMQILFRKEYNTTSVAISEAFGQSGVRKELNIALLDHSVSTDDVLRLVNNMIITLGTTGRISWRATFLPELFDEYPDQCLEFRYNLEVAGPLVSIRVSSEDPLPIIIAVHEKCGFTTPRDPDTGEAYPSTLLLPLD